MAANGVNNITYRVKAITGIYDFTLAANPYYPDTSVEVRELAKELKREQAPATVITEDKEKALKQLREMRHAAQRSMFNV